MKRIVLAALAALSLAGCAKEPWVRPGSTPAMAEAELRQCYYEASMATASVEPAFERGNRRSNLTATCMRARGWQ